MMRWSPVVLALPGISAPAHSSCMVYAPVRPEIVVLPLKVPAVVLAPLNNKKHG